ncbi:MAG TPA: FG-GAP-like repeat-containing protein, partial [Rhodothermales bacterium]|nr:FG-GAP-like repeat-containing protein [Rhodothermales bacterium]
LMMGDARRDSAAAPAPGIVLYREGTSRVRLVPSLPALFASRLALRGSVLAMAGRGGSGLTLEVYTVTRAATPTFTRLAQLPGLEFPALALGDCDADGDNDLFAAGADANGLPVATLYRNNGGTFTAVATLPGLFRGDAAFGDADGDGDDDLAYTGARYGPGLAEGNVLAYRMQSCVPTSVVVPALLRNMIGEFLAFEDVSGDGRVDIAVSGFDEPFRDRLVYLRLASGDGAGNFAYVDLSQRQTFGVGSGTVLGLPSSGSRPSFLGIGIGNANIPGVWFYSRPGEAN